MFLFNRLKPLLYTLIGFAVGQVGLQALQLVTGLILVNYLTPHVYAAWAVFSVLQSAVTVLSDLGARDGVYAVMPRSEDGEKALPRIISAALDLRLRHMFILTPFTAAYLFYVWNTGLFSALEAILSFVTVFSSSWAMGWITYASIPWLLNRQMGKYYTPQAIASAFRIAILLLALIFNVLSVPLLIFSVLISMLVTGDYTKRAHLRDTGIDAPSPQEKRELTRYVYSLAPSVVYYTLQDQVGVYLLSFFGNARSIATVYALGRLGSIFVILHAFTAILLMPWVAKAPANSERLRVLSSIGIAALVAIFFAVLVILVPQIFLYVLGRSYSGATEAVRLSVSAACLTYVSTVIWSVIVARGRVRHWAGILYTIVIASVQLFTAIVFGVNDALAATRMALITAAAVLLFQSIHALIAFRTPARGHFAQPEA